MPDRIRGSYCQIERPVCVDSGTNALNPTSLPGPACDTLCDDNLYLQQLLRGFQSEAVNFANRFIPDAAVRRGYVMEAQRMSAEILARVRRGDMSVRLAAEEAHSLRNAIMDAARLRTSELGAAMAKELKPGGLKLTSLQEKYAQEFFKRNFQSLAESEKNQVYLQIVKAAGRTNEGVTLQMRRLSRLGKGFVILSMAIVIYKVSTADDKVEAVTREGVGFAGGMLGGAAGGAVAGLACGPGAPVCVTIGVFVGGAMGAFGFDLGYDWLKK